MKNSVSSLFGIIFLLIFCWFGSQFKSESTPEYNILPATDLELDSKVNWRQWDKDTFTDAQVNNKLVFLFLTPSWCSFCSQMENDVINNEDIAKILNDNFLPIRVDSERRPDISIRYQFEGYPSCVIITPDGNPVGGGTKMPVDSLSYLLNLVNRYWQQSPDVVNSQAQIIQRQFEKTLDSTTQSQPSQAVLNYVQDVLERQFDSTYGGFGLQPKFPLPDVNDLLFLATRSNGEPIFPEMIVKTLDAQLSLLDKEDGGFFRYAHFADWSEHSDEKLLEDNAKLLENYLDAYQLIRDEKYQQTSKSVLEFIKYALEKPNPVFNNLYTSSNSYAISALISAAQVLDDSSYAKLALTTIDKLLKSAFIGDGEFYHDIINNQTAPRGLLTDQVPATIALLDCYQYTGNKKYLEAAEKSVTYIIEKLMQPDGGLSLDLVSAKRIGRMKEVIKPFAVNCQAVELFMRLYHTTNSDKYKKRADELISYLFAVPIRKIDLRLCNLSRAYLWYSQYPVRFVITGSQSEKYFQLLNQVWKSYYPRLVIIHLNEKNKEQHLGEITFPANITPMLYICRENNRSIPIIDPDQVTIQIQSFLRGN